MTSSASASATTRIPIFRPGRHTAANGVSLTVTADELKAVAALYDPDTHEAPIVVGHPATNAPAWGWVRALEYADGELVAIGHQLDPTFRDWVDTGRFKKRSASWYLPDAPGNPRPGSLYLRHVGFLGAQPPAVKGLSEVQFHASSQGVVEFSASQSWSRTVNELFQSLRDGLLARFGLDETDKILPTWQMRQLTDIANAMAQEAETQGPPIQVSQFHETPMTTSPIPTPAAAPVPAPVPPSPLPAPDATRSRRCPLQTLPAPDATRSRRYPLQTLPQPRPAPLTWQNANAPPWWPNSLAPFRRARYAKAACRQYTCQPWRNSWPAWKTTVWCASISAKAAPRRHSARDSSCSASCAPCRPPFTSPK